MSLATIRTLYARHWWANRTLLDAAAALGVIAYRSDHGTHHRSEIATMLTMVSGSPPETGLARLITEGGRTGR